MDERDGFYVEYSPGQEAYAEAMFASLREFAVKEAELAAAPRSVLPGSFEELLADRDEILRQLASEIGLAAPTEHQGRIFDAMLDVYGYFSAEAELNRYVEASFRRPSRIEIWSRADLVRRLCDGEDFDGYRYDSEHDILRHTYTIPSLSLVVGDLVDDGLALVQSGNELAFTYGDSRDGVVYLEARWQRIAEHQWMRDICGFTPKTARPAPLSSRLWRDRWTRALVDRRLRIAEMKHAALPVWLDEDERAPNGVADELVGAAWAEYSTTRSRPVEADAEMVHAILHEVVDAGIVENYLAGSDRRWLCEGVAEYVAWKVLRDRYGEAVARRGQYFDANRAEFATLAPEIDLRGWRTPELMSKTERQSVLEGAHYAFAMRAVSEMVRQNGEDLPPKLFREIAKTPLIKARMSTVERSYRKLTGKRLKDLIREAERAPVTVDPK